MNKEVKKEGRKKTRKTRKYNQKEIKRKKEII